MDWLGVVELVVVVGGYSVGDTLSPINPKLDSVIEPRFAKGHRQDD